ncbi:copper resistance D family protein [Salinicoccus sp. HZC-1]|uniref:copper resistance D family protein n=1 Tax=Salinicoccus sp. HZC-1 TaxID=3385497 RepID=UPI00398AD01E
MVIVSQLLLYLCLSLLMGVVLGNSFFAGRMPKFHVPKWLLVTAAAGVIVFGFSSSLAIILNMAADLSFAGALWQVLFGFNTGRAWLFMYLISVILIAFFAFDMMEGRAMMRAGVVLVALLAVAQSFGSHAFEQAAFWGVTVHAVHLLAVMTWSGLLIILGWFTVEKVKWTYVLSWFTRLALISIIVLAVSGVFTGDVVTANPQGAPINIFQRFANAWLTDYGQSLLFKQLLLVGILGFGIINGILYRKRLRDDPGLQIQPWIKAESFLVLIILAVTAFMSEQAIPNQIDTIIERNGASGLFEAVYGQGLPAGLTVALTFDAMGVVMLVLAAVFFGFMLYAAKMRMHAAVSLLMALCFTASAYTGLMLSVA